MRSSITLQTGVQLGWYLGILCQSIGPTFLTKINDTLVKLHRLFFLAI